MSRKVVLDLMDYRKHSHLLMGMINMIEEHYQRFDSWIKIGPIDPDASGVNALHQAAEENLEVGDFVIVLFEVPEIYDRAFDQFVFAALEDWGPFTVYTEPTTIL